MLTNKDDSRYQQLKVAVVGCGNWGKNHIRVLSELGALYALCDSDPSTASLYGEKYGVPRFSLEKIIDSKQIDAVFIATPACTHHKIAISLIESGKHVFVEKPIALSMSESLEIVQKAKEQQCKLMVGHLLHYHSAFQKLKELKQDDTLGDIQYIYSNRLNLGKFRTEENIWWSFAPHDVSMILALTGEMPNTVTAMGAKYLMHTVADVTCTHLAFSKGTKAHIFVSWLHPYKEQKLIVVGEKAMAIFDDGQPWESKLKLHPYPVEWVDGLPQPSQSCAENVAIAQSEPLKDECRHFLDCILDDRQPITDGDEAIRVLSVLNAAETSIEENQPIYMSTYMNSNSDHNENPCFTHETATIDEGAFIGENTKVWHYSHIYPGTRIGNDCVIGQNACIGPNVNIGTGCKIQNNVSIYEGITLEEEVFVGPSAVFTNVTNPRAFVNRKSEFSTTLVKKGATIGANATIVCGHTLGEYCFIAAGAVVTKDVPAHALMAGVPAKQIGWVSHEGEPLDQDGYCPRSGKKYQVIKERLFLAS